MARNREPVKPVESQSESVEEEEEESSDSEAEPTPTQTATRKAPPPPPSSSEEESGSESESESDGPDPNAKAVAPKPAAEETPESARSKPKSPEPVTPAKSAASKRPAEEDPATDAKKSKKAAAEPETSEKKSNLFQRLWTEDDEIVILEGMIDYVAKNKSDPISDLNGFHNFIKKNLHADFTRTQLQDKIRRLKKKYVNNKSKGKEGKFSKPHEQTAYELSKSIWGVKEGVKENGGVAKKKPAVVSGEGEGEAVKMNSNLSMNSNFNSNSTMEERMLGAGEEVFGLGKGVEGEKEWQKLRKEELQLYLKHLEMRVAQTKLVLGVMEGRK